MQPAEQTLPRRSPPTVARADPRPAADQTYVRQVAAPVVDSQQALPAKARKPVLIAGLALLILMGLLVGAPVVFGGTPRFYGVGAFLQPLRAIVDGYAAVLRDDLQDVAARYPDLRFVDIAELASPRFLGVPDAMSSDEFHPSTIGYGFWADALAPAVVEVAAGR